MLARWNSWLVNRWWGIGVVYALALSSSYAIIWAFIEPIGIPDSFEKLPTLLNSRWFYHVLASIFIAAHLTVLVEAIYRKRSWPSSHDQFNPKLKGAISEFDILDSREEYLSAYASAIKSSQVSLSLFTSMMKKAADSKDAEMINSELSNVAKRGIKPRVLVAMADTRLPGAIELARQGLASVRFDASLHLADVNYTCVDEKVAVVGERPFQPTPRDYKSSENWYKINSATLSMSLGHHFDGRWSDFGTLTLIQHLRKIVPRNVSSHGIKRVSELLGLPIERVVQYSSSLPLVILLAGRPGSGKTTVANVLVERLKTADINVEFLSDLPYFRQLFSKKPSSKLGFEVTSDGGFLVTNDSIWMAATDSLAAGTKSLPSTTSIAIIECARSSYVSTLARLASNGIRPEFIAYLDTPFDLACRRNILRRDLDGGHYVSNQEMEKSYRQDDFKIMLESPAFHGISVTSDGFLGSLAIAEKIYESFRAMLDEKAMTDMGFVQPSNSPPLSS
jgi:adenylate kinase family enzyme